MSHRLEQRMYGLVPYQLTGIQKGIQFGHAVVEYGLEYSQGHADSPYLQWARNDKTFIILNGGTTNKNRNSKFYGSLNQACWDLNDIGVQYATFYEPDLGDQLTAVVFLADERIWDTEKYPDYVHSIWPEDKQAEHEHYDRMFGSDMNWILDLRKFTRQFRLA